MEPYIEGLAIAQGYYSKLYIVQVFDLFIFLWLPMVVASVDYIARIEWLQLRGRKQ